MAAFISRGPHPELHERLRFQLNSRDCNGTARSRGYKPVKARYRYPEVSPRVSKACGCAFSDQCRGGPDVLALGTHTHIYTRAAPAQRGEVVRPALASMNLRLCQ